MPDLTLIREHMEVTGADGQHVGAVLRLQGDRLLLASAEADAGSEPFVPVELIDLVDHAVRLKAPAREVISRWLGGEHGQTEETPITS